MIKKIAVFSIFLAIFFGFHNNFLFKKNDEKPIIKQDENYNSNLLENIKYVAKDNDGNEYIISAQKGEIDLNNSDIIFLKNVKSQIKLNNSDNINITSDYGKYNVSNYNTIFSRNVIITYVDNTISSEYLDFSLIDNRMIISRNIVFTNEENVLKADVIEIDTKTKDAKIFMHEENKKVNIKNRNYSNGNN